MWWLLMWQVVASNPDLVQGKRWYDTQCASCHGVNGDGGRGANLATPRLRHASDDEALRRVISRGIAGTEMPRSILTSDQVRDVAAYVRSLGRTAPVEVTGDTKKGAAIFEGKGNCRRCHTLNGTGGAIGPDLSDIGTRTSPGYLRRSLTSPQAVTPVLFRFVRTVDHQGRHVEGIRVNEDTFSIQIRDLEGKLHSLWKADLRQIEKDRHSPMPSYQSALTAAELDDLVAYLVSLE